MSDSPSGVLVTSRSFAEYLAFFSLEHACLPARILDCSAGASSFVAEARRRGVDALAVDPAYENPTRLLIEARAGVAGGAQLIADNQDRFVYDWYGSPSRRARMRRDALEAFVRDYSRSPERYLPAALPGLPLETDSFDLALCSHLLFTWATHYDELWHLASLVELCRVATEVRVFPLVLQGTGEAVEFLPSLRDRLKRGFGINSNIVTVAYEFQRGAHHMLQLSR